MASRPGRLRRVVVVRADTQQIVSLLPKRLRPVSILVTGAKGAHMTHRLNLGAKVETVE